MPPAARSHVVTSQRIIDRLDGEDLAGKKILDLGAGHGHFTQLLAELLDKKGLDAGASLFACDINTEAYEFERIPCQRGDFNEGLSYADGSFDYVCVIEVVEHIEDPFRFVREIRRILKPGGRLFLTTPNILNLNSRLRFFATGLYPLFNVLPAGPEVDPGSTDGHISPLSYLYLEYMLRKNGFTEIEFFPDRIKRSAVALLALFYPALKTMSFFIHRRLRRKRPELHRAHPEILSTVNSLPMLTSRTLIMTAVK